MVWPDPDETEVETTTTDNGDEEMKFYLSLALKLVDAGKVGGWVRTAIAAGLSALLAKWPILGNVLDPTVQAAISTALVGIIVGIWSQLAKKYS